MPFIPKMAGSTTIVININTKDLENASMAEITPLDSAVNMPLANILNPIKKRAIVHILFPVTARLYTGLSGRANTDTRGLVSKNDTITVSIEINAITLRLVEISFLSLACS